MTKEETGKVIDSKKISKDMKCFGEIVGRGTKIVAKRWFDKILEITGREKMYASIYLVVKDFDLSLELFEYML